MPTPQNNFFFENEDIQDELSCQPQKFNKQFQQINPQENNLEQLLIDFNSSREKPNKHQNQSHLMFSPQYDKKILARHAIQQYKGLIYCQNMLQSPSIQYITSKQLECPPKDPGRYTLLLDLDETLVHACSFSDIQQSKGPQYYIEIDSQIPQDTLVPPLNVKVGVNVRPYCTQFLRTLVKNYEIYIFTASQHCYAQEIVKLIDPEGNLVKGILSRQHCMQTNSGFFIKDLRILLNRCLSQTVIVDNNIHSFGFQIENGVPICDWEYDQNDKELLFLGMYLTNLHNSKQDVREYNKMHLRLHEMSNYTPQQFLQTL